MGWRVLLGSLCLWMTLCAQVLPRFGEERLGISTAVALQLLGSARDAALARAALAMPDVTGVWSNPALGGGPHGAYGLGLLSHRFVAELWYHAACFSYHIADPSTILVSASALVVPPIEETTEFRPYGTGRQVRFGHWTVGIGYAHQLTEQFTAGIALRYLHERWAEAVLQGLLWDAGTLYWTGIGSLRLAVAISHFGFPLKGRGTVSVRRPPTYVEEPHQGFQEFAPPTVVRLGAAGEVVQTQAQRWSWMVAIEHPSDAAESYALASEYAFRFSAAFPAELSLRAGLRAYARQWWSAGVGIALPVSPLKIRLDWALSAQKPLGLVWYLGCVLEPLQLP